MNYKLKRFQKIFTAYQQKFGLNGYKVYFKYETINDSFASIVIDQDGLVATARLNSSLPDKDKPFQNIHGSAKHEAIHLLVGRFSDYSQSRYITRSDVTEAEEELVRRLEQLIPDIKGLNHPSQ